MTGDENLKQAAIDVLSQLGYNVTLEEKPKMPDPFLKRGTNSGMLPNARCRL